MEKEQLIKPFGPTHPIFQKLDELSSIKYFLRPSKLKRMRMKRIYKETISLVNDYVTLVQTLVSENHYYFDASIFPSTHYVLMKYEETTAKVNLIKAENKEPEYPLIIKKRLLATICDKVNGLYPFHLTPAKPSTLKAKVGKLLRAPELSSYIDISNDYPHNQIAGIVSEILGAEKTSVQPYVHAFMCQLKGQYYIEAKYPH